MKRDATASIRERAARMRRFVSILWTLSFLLVVLERFSAVSIALFRTHSSEAMRAFACQAVAAVPEALFLLGLWWVRHALAAIARGELFAAPMSRMLHRVGIVLAAGSAIRIAIVPGACRLLGFNPSHWIAFDAAGMVLGALGLALTAIAGVLRHASVLQSELDEIF